MPDRMERSWIRASDTAVTVSTSVVTLTDLFIDWKTESSNLVQRGTVSAFYGESTILPKGLLASGATFRLAMGIGVMDNGVTAATVPNPIDQSFPWMWKYEGFIHPNAIESATATFVFIPIYKPIEIRSQRIVRNNESLFFVATHNGSPDVVITIAGNILWKQR